MATVVFINEIHYENVGLDVNEGIEIAGPAGTNLDNWKLLIYEGGGALKNTVRIKGLIPNLQNGFGTLYYSVSLPNDSKGNGIAIVNAEDQVVQFLSWGANITATQGAANGKHSTLLPVKESGILTPPGFSLQLSGKGNKYEDFTWEGPLAHTFAKVNRHQTFVKAEIKPIPSPSPHSAVPETPVVIDSIDLLADQNRKAHRTDKIHNTDLVAVRRGQPIQLALSAKALPTHALIRVKPYPETDQGRVVEVKGNQPTGDPLKDWSAFFTGANGSIALISVVIPGQAIVGQYTLSASGDGGSHWTVEVPITILFNAWSRYVLNESGFIWVGSQYSNSGRPWNFGQFNTTSIQAALLLLQQIPPNQRGDVVIVARGLSALVNSSDDNGVLTGNWSSNYAGGTPPTSWTGSADILKEYVLKRKPVKYGQCWVFSGTLTTVCRALGIPARSVTNFASAHDVPAPYYNRSVDHYFKPDGVTVDDDKTIDSVWNFHVWNDVWLARRDLKAQQYTGWQAIDATPQEKSGGKYQLGPVPIAAVKQGLRDINYDIEFVYSEVNADENYYVSDGKGGNKLIRTVTDSVGKLMSTKAVGKDSREDVTLQYKYPEKSLEERASHGSTDSKGDVVFSWDIPPTKLGDIIHAKLQVIPKVSSITVTAQLVVQIITYTGKPLQIAQSSNSTIQAKVGATTTIPFDFKPDTYSSHLKGTDGILFRAYVIVKETGQTTIVQHEFDFAEHEISISIPEKVVVGGEPTAIVQFTNPLAIKLNNLVLKVEGDDLTKVQIFKFPYLDPKATLTQRVPLKVWTKGEHMLISTLDTDEINDLKGYLRVVAV